MNDYEFNFNNDKTYQALFRIYQENKLRNFTCRNGFLLRN